MQILNLDKELSAQISFPDYKSLCEAAIAIDTASKSGSTLRRIKTKTKALFDERTSIFVRNLPEEVGDDDLFDEFQKIGPVVNCQVLRDHESRSKKIGLVNFVSAELAQKAIQ